MGASAAAGNIARMPGDAVHRLQHHLAAVVGGEYFPFAFYCVLPHGVFVDPCAELMRQRGMYFGKDVGGAARVFGSDDFGELHSHPLDAPVEMFEDSPGVLGSWFLSFFGHAANAAAANPDSQGEAA